MSISSNFKALPKSTKRLMSLGLIVGLVVALPLFIWSIINLTFDVREKAQAPSTVIDIIGEPVIGPSTAPVIIVAYQDFLCPFCKSFVDNTFSTILSNYPNEVKFVFKDFPLTPIHALAEKAAIAGQCAFAQNKFWEMHDLIFANQDTLVESDFATFATQINLDTTAFNDCYTNQTPLNEINADYAEGQSLGVSGTPTFFINGTKLEGAHPYQDFKTLIDAALLDDVFFNTSGNTVSFTTTDQTPNVSVNPEDLVNGKTYVLNVNYSLQNNVKYPEATNTAIPVILLVNNVFKSSKDIPYSLIAAHTDGSMDSQSTSFTVQDSITNIQVVFDPNDILAESNNDNNTLNFNFSGQTATATGSAVSTATATAVATAISTPTSSPAPTSEPTQGEPNSCGGTCGSNYNCKANLYCYQGYCRNPICSEKTDCICVATTSTPKATAKSQSGTKGQTIVVATAKGSPKPTPTYVSGITRLPDEQTDLVKAENSAPENQFFAKYAIYIFGAFVVIVGLIIAWAVKRTKYNNIPHILPPTNI